MRTSPPSINTFNLWYMGCSHHNRALLHYFAFRLPCKRIVQEFMELSFSFLISIQFHTILIRPNTVTWNFGRLHNVESRHSVSKFYRILSRIIACHSLLESWIESERVKGFSNRETLDDYVGSYDIKFEVWLGVTVHEMVIGENTLEVWEFCAYYDAIESKIS